MNLMPPAMPKMTAAPPLRKGQPRLRTLKRMLMKPTGGGATGGGGMIPFRPTGG